MPFSWCRQGAGSEEPGRVFAGFFWVAVILALGGCGGAETSGSDRKHRVEPVHATGQPLVAGPVQDGAVLNAAELSAAELNAQAADHEERPASDDSDARQWVSKRDYMSGEVARKATASRIPVYRFFNGATGAHFFTTNATERDNVQATMSPPFLYEGTAFSVASAFSPGLSAVHRFHNTRTGVHFYTISEAERANVQASMPQFSYEGVAYYASQVFGQGFLPFYRFFVPSRGTHFYTANQAERDQIIANLSGTYQYEGVGYYVLDSNWLAEKLPHSGVSNQQCYQAGTYTLISCQAPESQDLNADQDGHRLHVNPMSFSAVGGRSLTSCVKDNVTGLVWEGKPDDSGLRDKDLTYTNLLSEATSDATGYVNYVNSIGLCGYNTWRLPSRLELMSIGSHGRIAPAVDPLWFPNTADREYWTADGLSSNSDSAWHVNATFGYSQPASRANALAVRLVTGTAYGGVRYTFSSVAYGADAANNVVNDALTGLQWRRCEQGRTWTGNSCTGTVSLFSQEQALVHARDQSGWRLPSSKELASLPDLTDSSGARINALAFPFASSVRVWSSTPCDGGNVAWMSDLNDGTVFCEFRSAFNGTVRLVRKNT